MATRCPKASEATLNNLSRLADETALSDFMIICGEREWKVHRFVLCLHSTVLQTACTHAFKEEKDRVIDLSEEDPDCITAFVHYIYKLNYDATLVRGKGDHLSLHVQMCVLADKYDMHPLQDLAIEKFKTLANNKPTESDVANAAICAYDAVGATTEIRKMIVELAIENKLIPTDISAEPTTDFERAMQSCPGLCLDILKVQQSMLKPVPRSFYCPARCGNTGSLPISMQNIHNAFLCSRCSRQYYGWQWCQSPAS